MLDLFGRNQRALLTGVDVDGVCGRGDLNGFIGAAGSHLNVANGTLVAWIQVNGCLLKGAKARRGDVDVVVADRKGREGEDTGIIRDRVPLISCCLVLKKHVRVRNYRATGIGDDASQARGGALRECRDSEGRGGGEQEWKRKHASDGRGSASSTVAG